MPHRMTLTAVSLNAWWTCSNMSRSPSEQGGPLSRLLGLQRAHEQRWLECQTLDLELLNLQQPQRRGHSWQPSLLHTKSASLSMHPVSTHLVSIMRPSEVANDHSCMICTSDEASPAKCIGSR